MDEQITKKDVLMPYIEELKDLPTKKILEPIKKSYVDKLTTLRIPLARIIERFSNYDIKIQNHWKEFGQNYDINPSLSLVPILQDSFSDYITMSEQKEEILVDCIKELLTKANEIEDTPLQIIKPIKKKDVETEEKK